MKSVVKYGSESGSGIVIADILTSADSSLCDNISAKGPAVADLPTLGGDKQR